MPSAPATSFSIPRILLDRFSRLLFAPRPIGDEAAAPVENPWQKYWGEVYGPELKQWLLKPVFEALESEGKIGDVIVDVGSGAKPVTRFLKARAGRKRIFVDIAAGNSRSAEEQKIRLDVEKVAELGALSFRKALSRVCGFLEIDPKAGQVNVSGADTIVFSDILNYVDFEKVLRGFASYLKTGGRMIVINLPIRGNQALFSEKGLKDNRQLYRFLEEHDFKIEHKSFPKRSRKETDESEELIVLVARKCRD